MLNLRGPSTQGSLHKTFMMLAYAPHFSDREAEILKGYFAPSHTVRDLGFEPTFV